GARRRVPGGGIRGVRRCRAFRRPVRASGSRAIRAGDMVAVVSDLAAGPDPLSGGAVRVRNPSSDVLRGAGRRDRPRGRDRGGAMNNLELAAHWLRGRETLPRYLILGMTNLCNSKCVTCFYWDHLNVNRHLEMQLEEYDRALADLPSLYSVVLTGGEPTLNRDLPAVTRLLYRRHDA